jgi:hypothetical protein
VDNSETDPDGSEIDFGGLPEEDYIDGEFSLDDYLDSYLPDTENVVSGVPEQYANPPNRPLQYGYLAIGVVLCVSSIVIFLIAMKRK